MSGQTDRQTSMQTRAHHNTSHSSPSRRGRSNNSRSCCNLFPNEHSIYRAVEMLLECGLHTLLHRSSGACTEEANRTRRILILHTRSGARVQCRCYFAASLPALYAVSHSKLKVETHCTPLDGARNACGSVKNGCRLTESVEKTRY